MPDDHGDAVPPGIQSERKRIINAEAIVVGYCMSRLNTAFLTAFAFDSWKHAFRETGETLGIPPASVKGLRDEFDPVHANGRMGWRKRPLRANRQRVLGEFCGMSDRAVLDIAKRILSGDARIVRELIRPMFRSKSRTANVAERMKTGRLAEDYFVANSETICGISKAGLIDRRDHACGYDYGTVEREGVAIEVKGMKGSRGHLLFTDQEWRTASRLGIQYWLVVVAGIEAVPAATVVYDPASVLSVTTALHTTSVITWKARYTMP